MLNGEDEILQTTIRMINFMAVQAQKMLYCLFVLHTTVRMF